MKNRETNLEKIFVQNKPHELSKDKDLELVNFVSTKGHDNKIWFDKIKV